jgi:hypothetical protein
MFGRFFNTAEVDAYADWVLGEVKKAFPLGRQMKDVGERADKLKARISSRTGEFARTAKLNLYKKARLTHRLRSGMSAHGYPGPFIDSFSLDLVAQIARFAKRGR